MGIPQRIIKPLDSSGIAPAAEQTDPSQSNADRCDQKLLKPMPEYANSEFRELAAIITRDIFLQNPNVKWTDIAGLSSSKRLIKGHCVSNQVSQWSVKWRGDSEKLVRVLFELARYHAPSTIFLDELEMDGLAKGNEHVFLLGASNLPWDLDVPCSAD
ncbi:hypothetical protein BASA83_003998 [Batrachochytrium salamandrivorans]|nr:hypothetical protein BASA83_003998 [Batrachochytrium salamandrivorans]